MVQEDDRYSYLMQQRYGDELRLYHPDDLDRIWCSRLCIKRGCQRPRARGSAHLPPFETRAGFKQLTFMSRKYQRQPSWPALSCNPSQSGARNATGSEKLTLRLDATSGPFDVVNTKLHRLCFLLIGRFVIFL